MIIEGHNMAEDNLIKVGMLVKRSQQKKSIGPVNYKERVFVLTKEKLSYFEGDLKSRGKLKGTVNVSAIKFVGPLDDKALNKPCSFQIVHKDYFLYCTARNQNERDDWIDALQKTCCFNTTLHDKFHPQTYSGRTWNCCGKSGKDTPGCRQLQKSYPTHLSLPDLPTFQHKPSISVSYKTNSQVQHISLPTPPVQKTAVNNPPAPPPRKPAPPLKIHKFIVTALYNFQPYEQDDIELHQGLEYYVLDDSKPHWWLVRNDVNQEGYVPANYVKAKQEDKNDINNMGWFQKDLSRPQAEKLLLSEEKEGCFVVRKSSQPDAIYTLSVSSKGGVINGHFYVMHYHIKKASDGKFYLSEKHMQPTVVELIQYHQHNAGGLITRLRFAPQRFNHSAVPLHMFDDDRYEINLHDLELLDELGSGQFGVVRLAKFKKRQKVAVKMMREGAMEEDSFIDEAKVMTKLKHDNLVQLYGVVTKQRPICIVTEFMENGDLLSYVRSHRELLNKPSELLDMCLQICGAMQYLEENNLIHRDLAARNCLVGKNNTVKVSDFGLTRFVPDDEYTTSAGSKFPIKWASPEVLQFATFSSKSDVWAFGVLMWEVYSGGKMPYVAWSNSEVAEQVVVGYHLESPSYCPPRVYKVMEKTWAFEPADRPSFAEIYERIFQLLEQLQH